MQYLDFELEIASAGDGSYTVRVLRSPAGEATGTMHLSLESMEVSERIEALQTALLRSGTSGQGRATPEGQTVEQFGKDLWAALFNGDVLAAFEVSRKEARQQGHGMRLKLRLGTPELAALPWEYLYDTRRDDYLSVSSTTPLVRYIPLQQAIEPLLVTPPLRILAMVASPSEYPALDVEREKRRLDRAVAKLTANGIVELTWLEGQTPHDLLDALQHPPWHVFHFIGHGGFDAERGEGVVLFADDSGAPRRVVGKELGRLLGDHDALRLAVLNSCDSARGDQADVFSSTAASLVRRGTPAVVAMQYEITDEAAIEFSRSFYNAIAAGIPVDAAVAEARKGIALSIPNTLEWGTPVLFMRAPDGVLFNVPATAPVPVLPQPQPRKAWGRRVAIGASIVGGLVVIALVLASIAEEKGVGRIAYSTAAGITTVAPDGSDPRPLAGTGTGDTDPTWAPDASSIAYHSESGVRIARASDEGITAQLTEGGNDFSPAWSPDGETIAFASDRAGGELQIYLMGLADGSEPQLLRASDVEEHDPTWSPDGSMLAFASGPRAAREIVVFDADSGFKTITSNETDDVDPAWSPDGQSIAFASTSGGDFDLWQMRPDGTELTQLTTGPAVDHDPAWSPDGRAIAFSRSEGGPSQIYVLQLKTGEAEPITGGDAGAGHPSWR